MTVAQTDQTIIFTGATSGKNGTSNSFDVIVKHTITASAGTGGTISPTGTVLINDGANQTFTITPNTGYHIATLTVDGSAVTPAATYTFTSVTANHTIAASFSGLPQVASEAATNITSSGATLNGSLSDKGSASTATLSFEYGTTTGYGSSLSGSPATLTSPGTFTANLTSLNPSTTYHYRSIAAGNGTAYGQDMTFTTSNSSSGSSGGSSSGGGGGGGPPPAPTPGGTDLTDKLNPNGALISDVAAPSEDGVASVTIPAGTIGFTSFGFRLTQITVIPMTNPPAPPADTSAVGLVYDFGPNGTYFSQQVFITISYDPTRLPEGVDEASLYIAWFNPPTQEWIKLDSTVDLVHHTITAGTKHFTAFSAFAPSKPPKFILSKFNINPTQINTGEAINVSVTLENLGDLTGSYPISLLVNEETVDSKTVKLNGHTEQIVTFITTQVPQEPIT